MMIMIVKRNRSYSIVAVTIICIMMIPVWLALSGTQQKRDFIEEKSWYFTGFADSGLNEGLSFRAALKLKSGSNIFMLSGFCNQITGRYTLHAKTKRITFYRFASTWKYCSDFDSEVSLTNFLKCVTRYSIRGDSLLLYDQNKLVMTFVPGRDVDSSSPKRNGLY